MAPHAQSLKLLRVVIREDFSLSRARLFLRGPSPKKYPSTWFYANISIYADLLDTLTVLDKAPASVHEYLKVEHKEHIEVKADFSLKETFVQDSHSLQGRHGKTHGIC